MKNVWLHPPLFSVNRRFDPIANAIPCVFLILAATHFIATFVDILGIWVLFDRFKMIQGWTLAELALIYGIMHMGFAAAEASAEEL